MQTKHVLATKTGLTAVLLAGLLAVGGCGGAGAAEQKTSGSPSATPTPTTTTDPTSEVSKSPTKKQSAVADPIAPTSIPPVKRNGRVPRPSIKAKAVGVRSTVVYSDGVKLRITSIKQGRVTGEGPGVVKGPETSFALTLTNGTDKPLTVDQAVVTLVHGSPGRVARPVYTDDSRDFAGTAKPGKKLTAIYSFAIGSGQLDKVTINVDFDATHTAAVFTGSAR